ncbi:patatin-like phospholipase domain-containing protein 2 isoform X2 [Polyodon spathula]|uniref:patatin-like phospholipase domain-containing protein 2 isoform X2 n=1 Tax=Polyodon spathula TaxID=7913 RepID=UPI001B7F4CDB|nr:patatin-like phospholipase domain-containing protein 2 isoform X2 [Polyodon spathula]
MFDLEGGWNVSFAGCGFLGVYHVGVASCFQEKAPYLIRDANKIYGASAGALTAAALVCGACLAQCCADVMDVAKEARKRNLGPLHPTFNLVKILRNGLYNNLPENAHELATGRLCISLTRVSDGENVLVSEFSSKEELIQRYVDGGISNNLPQYELKNTITISPFSGESDICPRDNSSNFHELRVTNTSIQFSLNNFYRLTRALFPPEPKILAEMCQQGYNDALRFLKENNIFRLHAPVVSLAEMKLPAPTCFVGERNSQGKLVGKIPTREEATKNRLLRAFSFLRKRHWSLDEQFIENLPPALRKAVFDACKEKSGLYAQVSSLLPIRVASYMLLPYTLPVESAYSVAVRLVEWLPDFPDDVRWLQEQLRHIAGSVYQQAIQRMGKRQSSTPPLRKCRSLPLSLEMDQPYLGLAGYHQFSSVDLDRWYLDFHSPPALLTKQAHLGLIPSSSPRQICYFASSQDSEAEVGLENSPDTCKKVFQFRFDEV